MIKGHPVSELEEILKKEPHITGITRDKWSYSNKPVPKINPALWTESAAEELEGLTNYLSSVYIVDDWGTDHTSRREWKKKLEKKYDWFKDFYHMNALRLNSFANVRACVSLMSNNYVGTNKRKFDRKASELMDFVASRKHDYNEMAIEQKTRYTKATKKQVYGLLKFLSKQKLPEDRNPIVKLFTKYYSMAREYLKI